jgi:hypothetical protein
MDEYYMETMRATSMLLFGPLHTSRTLIVVHHKLEEQELLQWGNYETICGIDGRGVFERFNVVYKVVKPSFCAKLRKR